MSVAVIKAMSGLWVLSIDEYPFFPYGWGEEFAR